MHLGVIHTIRDRAAWDSALGGAGELPSGFALLGSVTQDDASRAISSGTRRALMICSACWTACSGRHRSTTTSRRTRSFDEPAGTADGDRIDMISTP